MTKEVGLWIDHRQAVIVTLGEGGDEIKHIESNTEKHGHPAGATPSSDAESHDRSGEDIRDRRFGDHLNKYYDEVIAVLHDADSILIMGPGEAKGELHKRLDAHKASKHLVETEPADKMTDGQIAALVKQHFHV